MGSHSYFAKMDNNFGESEFDHLLLLQLPVATLQSIPFRESEIQALHAVHIDEVEDLFNAHFRNILLNHQTARSRFTKDNFEEVLGDISKQVDLIRILRS